MSEFRSALRGVPIYLIFGFFATMVVFAIGDLFYPVPAWAPAASGILVFVPGLAAGLSVGGGWRRGLVSGLLGFAAVGAILLAFMVLVGGFGRTLGMLGRDLTQYAGLAAASMAAGAGGGALRVRWRPQLETVGSAISWVLGADRPRPVLPRSLVVLQWTAVLLAVVGWNLLSLLGRDRLPPQVLEWAPVAVIGVVAVAFAVIRRRIRKALP